MEQNVVKALVLTATPTIFVQSFDKYMFQVAHFSMSVQTCVSMTMLYRQKGMFNAVSVFISSVIFDFQTLTRLKQELFVP